MRFRLRRKPAHPAFDAPLRPDETFLAVGDIHGCDGLLGELLAQIEMRTPPSTKLVLVGDYVDRGENSAEVLRRIHSMQTEGGAERMVCLRGNHDQMLLDFLDDPQSTGRHWFRHGGLQTLASYGIAGVATTAQESAWLRARDQLRTAMGEALEIWLRSLPTSWQTGNVFVCHAGADPAAPIDKQHSRTLIWGHPNFSRVPRADGIWVVHGHTIIERAHPQDGRIPVDTGAYATGLLTAALLEAGRVQFFST